MDSALLCEDFCLNKSFCRFDTHEAAQLSVDYLSGLKLDGQTIRVEGIGVIVMVVSMGEQAMEVR